MKALRFVAALGMSAALPIAASSPQTYAAGPTKMMTRAYPHHTEAAQQLKMDMRKLWTDHVVWTRCYIISALADLPDAQAAANRLMRNQEDIGNAVAKFYGPAAGQQVTMLLKEHILIAVNLLNAAKAGDKAAQQAAEQRWQENAVQIADLLAKANPNLPRQMIVDAMKMHLSTTANEAVARLSKDWDEDVIAFDAVYDHILKMADGLADGIVMQFPEKFGMKPTATGGVRY
jgi:hypothetical protein